MIDNALVSIDYFIFIPEKLVITIRYALKALLPLIQLRTTLKINIFYIIFIVNRN